MSIKERIIDFIKKNRVSTTEVADALGKVGALPQVLPVNADVHEVGEIFCVFTANESNYQVHEEMRAVPENSIAIVFTEHCQGRAILGELVTKYALLYRGAKALVVDGLVRDIAGIRRSKFKVWCKGTTPIGCFNKRAEQFEPIKRAAIEQRYQGAIAVCDDGGVVCIENHQMTEELLLSLERIELQEDIWFFCLDTLKWDTKKIVCDKAYLTAPELFSAVHIEQMKALTDNNKS